MRTWRYVEQVLCPAVLLIAAGCGSPGPPVPPSLEIPRPATNLRATRKGDEVHLTWTMPTRTNEGQSVRHLGPTQICRSFDAAMTECGNPVAEVPAPLPAQNSSTGGREASYTDALPTSIQQEKPLAEVTYAVKVLNSSRRGDALSNQVQVPAAPTLAPPSGLRAEVTTDGVMLSWDPVAAGSIEGLQFVYRLERREGDAGNSVAIAQLPLSDGQFLDHGFEWEKSYTYFITVVTVIARGNSSEQVEGNDSAPVKVFAHDVFAPAVPTGLQAVASGPGQQPFIDLIWAPDTEPDLAGYNIYRSDDGGEWKKINAQPVQTPAYRDSTAQPGHAYSYMVSAVDLRANESGRSAAASEKMPFFNQQSPIKNRQSPTAIPTRLTNCELRVPST